jgi:hypothetical protein
MDCESRGSHSPLNCPSKSCLLQEVATPLVYYKIHLNSPLRVAWIKHLILNDMSIQNLPVRSLVRKLNIDGVRCYQEGGSHIPLCEPLTIMLFNLPLLCGYEAQNLRTGLGELLSLSRNCARTLTILDICICVDDDGAFALINELKELQKLWLTFIWVPTSVTGTIAWAHSIAHPISLPKVKDILWSYNGGEDSDLMSRYLGKCRFAPGCDIELWAPQMSAASARLFIPFFDINTVESANISVSDEAQAVLTPQLLVLSQLHLMERVPSQEILTEKTLPKLFGIDYPKSTENQPQFWDFLECLMATDFDFDEPRSMEIYIDDEGFRWYDGWDKPEHAEFIGKLLPISVRLLTKQIRVIDREGRAMTELMTE